MNSQNTGSRILLIGDNSYLARAFLPRSAYQSKIITQKRFDETAIDWRNISVVINFSLNPLYRTEPYCPEIDEDLKIANAIRNKRVHHIMLSSRLVYAPDQGLALAETAELGRENAYARNKVVTEIYLREALPERHTILRLGNIFDLELGRPTFFGIALSNLKRENEIVMDCLLETKRDFLPIQFFCLIIDQILNAPPIGTFNLSSGHAVSVGDIGQSVINGYGQGILQSTSSVITDAFSLDVGKLQSILCSGITEADVLSAAYRVGKLLKNA